MAVRFAAFAGLALIACGFSACGDESESSDKRALPQRGAPDASYTTKGRIERLPIIAPPSAASGLLIHHEAVPEFTNAEGVAVGMSAMLMEFPIAETVSLEGLEPGCVVEFEWAVWWKPGARGWQIRSIRRLPDNTPVDLGEPAPRKNPAPA